MQTKYKVPDDVKRTVLGYVRGYKRRLRWYLDQRSDILYGSPTRYEAYKGKDGKEGHAYQPRGGMSSNPTASAGERLAALEQHPNVRIMRAIERALEDVGNDIVSDAERIKLKDAIMESCVVGRNFTFEYWALPMSKDTFYNHRLRFIQSVAITLNII